MPAAGTDMNSRGAKVKWPAEVAEFNSSRKASGRAAAAKKAHGAVRFMSSPANSASSRKM